MRPTGQESSTRNRGMGRTRVNRRHKDVFTAIKIYAVEIAATTFFLVFVLVELTHAIRFMLSH